MGPVSVDGLEMILGRWAMARAELVLFVGAQPKLAGFGLIKGPTDGGCFEIQTANRWASASRGDDVTGSSMEGREEAKDDAVHGADADPKEMILDDTRRDRGLEDKREGGNNDKAFRGAQK